MTFLHARLNAIQLVMIIYLLYSALLKSTREGKRTGSYDPGPNARPPRVRWGNLLVLLARPPVPFYTVSSYVMKVTIKPNRIQPFTFENDSVFFPPSVVLSDSVYVPGPGLSSASSLVSDPNLRLVLLKPWCSLEATKKVWYLLGMDAMCDGESDFAVAVISAHDTMYIYIYILYIYNCRRQISL